MAILVRPTSSQQAKLPAAPPPWLATPEAATSDGAVPSLQRVVCAFLARHLHTIAVLDDLPEHLAEEVRSAIRRDRSLLDDEGLGVWLDAVLCTGDTRQLSLRWALNLGDGGLGMLRERRSWAANLLALDLGYCEKITDAGMASLCPMLEGLLTLSLCGCRGCGDGTAAALGRHCRQLSSLNLELLTGLTDIGVQSVVRGCGRLVELLLGGCARLSAISTSMIADHLGPQLRRLGLGGLASITDCDMEDIGKCRGLQWLELRACPRLSDAGVKQVGLLVTRQAKALQQWEERGGVGPPPPVLVHLDLGGLQRLSDEALLKLAGRARHLASLDLRGCGRLTADGLARAFASKTIDGVASAAELSLPCLRALTLTACPAASAAALALLREARPALDIAV